MTQSMQYEPYTVVGPDELLTEAADVLGLAEHLMELEVNGYTVIPPEKVGSTQFRDELEAAVRGVHARLVDADPERMKLIATGGAGEISSYALFENPVFERALMNPVVQTLARAMTGHACRISLVGAAVKPAGNASLGLHCDSAMTEPYPPVQQFCNVTYAITDYSEEKGSTIFVPGSHKLLRQPVGLEVDGQFAPTRSVAGMYAASIAKPRSVVAKAGSIIAWTGTTWHGAGPRSAPGERVSLLLYFCRWYLKTQANFRDRVPAESLARWQDRPRFAQLLDMNPVWGFTDDAMDGPKGVIGREVFPILDVPRP